MIKRAVKFIVLLGFVLQSCSYASQNETVEGKIFGKNYAQKTNAKISRRSPEGNIDNQSDNLTSAENSKAKLADNNYDAYQHYQAATPPKKAKRRPILNLNELNELMDREATITLIEKANNYSGPAPEISAESNLQEVIEYNKKNKVKHKRKKKKVKVLVIKKDANSSPRSIKNNNLKPTSAAKNNAKPVASQQKPALNKSKVIAKSVSANEIKAVNKEDIKAINSKPNLPPVSLPVVSKDDNVSAKTENVMANSRDSSDIKNQPPVIPSMQNVVGSMQPPVMPPMQNNAGNMQPPVMPPMQNNSSVNNNIENKIQEKLNQNQYNSSNAPSNSEQGLPMPPVPGTDDSTMFDLSQINKFLLELYFTIKYTLMAIIKSWFRFN